MSEEKKTVLNVEDLTVAFNMYQKGAFKKTDLEVIHKLSIDVKEGEIVAVVGSSGSGKSLLAHSILHILPKNAKVGGKIEYCGKELDDKYVKELLGRDIAFIPQSVDYLDPLMHVDKQVIGVYGNKERQREVFDRYHLDE